LAAPGSFISVAHAEATNMPKDQTFQGWTSYETWCIALWIDNEQHSYHFWREQAERCHDDCILEAIPGKCAKEIQIDAGIRLADKLTEYFADVNPLSRNPGPFADLVSAALSEVNWFEIATHLLEAEVAV
jgi:hypothetical protein